MDSQDMLVWTQNILTIRTILTIRISGVNDNLLDTSDDGNINFITLPIPSFACNGNEKRTNLEEARKSCFRSTSFLAVNLPNYIYGRTQP